MSCKTRESGTNDTDEITSRIAGEWECVYCNGDDERTGMRLVLGNDHTVELPGEAHVQNRIPIGIY